MENLAGTAITLHKSSDFGDGAQRLPSSMANIKTVHVPHLGGIDATYQIPHSYNALKPTFVLVNSFTTSAELYRDQYANK